MRRTTDLEVWQRGPISGVPDLLQPAAHALLQAAEDVEHYTIGLTQDQLWQRPGGVASPGFHLMHIRGVIDRLFTYARGEALSAAQLEALNAEKEGPFENLRLPALITSLDEQVARALEQLKTTSASTLTQARTLGRKKLPTTVGGLLFHAAEHSQRHVGQLLVTCRMLSKDIAP